MESDRLFAQLYLDTDKEQLAFASDRGLVVVTHNRIDFERLARQYYEEGRLHAGIVCAVRRPPRDCATRLIALLNDRTAAAFKDPLLYV